MSIKYKKNKIINQFKENGFLIKKNIFSKTKLLIYSKEFDRIVKQLKRSGENLNARWGSPITKKIEPKNSKVIHTHNVQSFSSTMLSMIQNKNLLDIIELLIGSDIILHHTKLFLKPPKIGSPFPLHQDWSYFPTENNSMMAAIVHLSDSTENMGCIRIISKSHKLGNLKSSDGHSYNSKIHKYKLEDSKPIIAKPGDILFFDARLLHGSMPNLSNKPRKTILLQFYSGKDKLLSNTKHTNVQLVLRGINHQATRDTVANI